EMGREVFAIPGSIHSPMSRGCHALIRQGAKLVESGQDIHEELDKPASQPTTAPAANKPAATTVEKRSKPITSVPEIITDSAARQVFDQLSHDPTSIDVLAARCQMDIQTLSAALLQLDLGGQIERLLDGRY